MANEDIIEDEDIDLLDDEDEDEDLDGGAGDGSQKFVEVDGKKFVADESGKAKLDDKNQPIPFIEKRTESLEDRQARLQRQLKQTNKKLGLDEDGKPLNKNKVNKNSKKNAGKDDNVLDRADKAFLVASGIKGSDEFALVEEIMQNTGRDLDTVIESRHFQAELKLLREDRAAKDAIPKNGKRSNNSSSTSVEYWIAKGELPPNTPENRKLRQDVVNARIAKSSDKKMFTDNAIGNANRK